MTALRTIPFAKLGETTAVEDPSVVGRVRHENPMNYVVYLDGVLVSNAIWASALLGEVIVRDLSRRRNLASEQDGDFKLFGRVEIIHRDDAIKLQMADFILAYRDEFLTPPPAAPRNDASGR